MFFNKHKIKSPKQNTSLNIRIILVFAILISVILGIFCLSFKDKIFPNTYVSDIYVGDKTKEQALEQITKEIAATEIKIIINGNNYSIATSEINYFIDYIKTVDRAYNLTNSGSLLLDFKEKINLSLKPKRISYSIYYDQDKLLESLLIISSKVGSIPVNPSAEIVNGQIVIDPGKDGVEIDTADAIQKIGFALSNNRVDEIKLNLKSTNNALASDQVENYKQKLSKLIGKSIVLKTTDIEKENISVVLDDKKLIKIVKPTSDIDEKQLTDYIIDVSRKINRNPQNSVFVVTDGKVVEFTPSKDGLTVNEDSLKLEIKSALINLLDTDSKEAQINIPLFKSPAKVKNEDVNNLGINTLLGKGVSYFRGSIPNRIHNVNLAQSKFKGVLVEPGATFSFNEILGDVSGLTGYKAAYVIKDGKTVLGDGGGVCQVSSTLYRAILDAGLPVIERRAHSYRVGYYEQGSYPGFDATVFYPTTDLKFKNDTPKHLLIQPTIDLTNLILTFDIYGTSDGRKSYVSKPVVSSQIAPADDLYVDDPSLPAGTIRQIEHKAWGARVTFDYKVTRGSEVLIDQKVQSTYRPWQAVYLRGTGVPSN